MKTAPARIRVVIVDDSASPDQEVFEDLEGYSGTEWVRVSDDVPVDEDGRDDELCGNLGVEGPTSDLVVSALRRRTRRRPRDR